MRKIISFVIVFFSVCIALSNGISTIDVDKYSRPVQIDGYPLEWSDENFISLDDSFKVLINLMNTSEGLAGYIQVPFTDSCFVWKFRFYTNQDNQSYKEITTDTSFTEGSFYAMNMRDLDQGNNIGVEWFIPWDFLKVKNKHYTIHLLAFNECGDSLNNFIISGNIKNTSMDLITDARLQKRFILIVILLTIYLIVMRKVSKRKVL